MAACAMKVSAQSRLVRARAAPAKSVTRSYRPVVAKLNVKPEHAIAVTTAAATLFTAGNAQAAQEIAALAGDSRVGTISLLFVPVVGWVGFNILGPAFRQLDSMSAEKSVAAPKSSTKRATRKASVAALVGAAASMIAVQSAEAATEFAQIADSDARVGAILTLFLPALGWVAFNIFGPATRQLAEMSADKAPASGTKKATKSK